MQPSSLQAFKQWPWHLFHLEYIHKSINQLPFSLFLCVFVYIIVQYMEENFVKILWFQLIYFFKSFLADKWQEMQPCAYKYINPYKFEIYFAFCRSTGNYYLYLRRHSVEISLRNSLEIISVFYLTAIYIYIYAVIYFNFRSYLVNGILFIRPFTSKSVVLEFDICLVFIFNIFLLESLCICVQSLLSYCESLRLLTFADWNIFASVDPKRVYTFW